ncbi:GntR family transcriptional regulator [Liquorilactobacillus vini]|uniref:HTH gntR-type domain-containing protein n=1 Tax=Liquorilactobacillus vini DSM 20605 TaxID=1133569 RepID=A0A0R2C685_9LACO|nr:GntR family transcriptional regulator [Liquorilactobacillus vini]KRM83945.1 hypothetical protein FD21_GL000171 [Liquorilactobacillus vini DSM 20605]
MLLPKYKEISEILIKETKNGKLKPGDRFYSETDLRKRFKVSSTTAVKVLNYLENQNVVTRIQGKGTFIAKENHQNIVLFTDLNLSKGIPEDVKVISVKIEKNPEIKKTMYLKNSDKYVKIVRLRYYGEKIIQYSTSYINQKFINLSLINKPDSFDSIYQRIQIDSELDPYLLNYSQESTGKLITDKEIIKYFPQLTPPVTFIQQKRKTSLPYVSPTLLEYTISYKLPEFWGIRTESATNKNSTLLWQW